MRWNRGALSTVDGPFAETKEVIGGFAILEAASMTERSPSRSDSRGPRRRMEPRVRSAAVGGGEFGGEARSATA